MVDHQLSCVIPSAVWTSVKSLPKADDGSIGHRFFQDLLIGGVGLFHVGPLRARNTPGRDVTVHRRFFFGFVLSGRR